MTRPRTVLGAKEIDRAITRIVAEIREDVPELADLVMLGIPKRGVPLANRIASELHAIEPSFQPAAATGQLDITMYRDDLQRQPTRTIGVTKVPKIDGKTVVLVDDVLYSGRTIRAALDALNDLGRPAIVRLAVLVDRQLRQLPIQPDFVGKVIPTSRTERVSVQLVETDGTDAVVIEQSAAGLSGISKGHN